MNLVPKDGGNTFATNISVLGTGGRFQSDNLTDELRARGLTSNARVKHIYDAGIGVGGPILRDRIWFYTAHRYWGNVSQVPGNYFNATQHTPFYTPDLSRPAFLEFWNTDNAVRLTFQASRKHKGTFYYSHNNSCQCYTRIDQNVAPEAGLLQEYPNFLMQGTWSYPATTRFLMEAGASYLPNTRNSLRSPFTSLTDIPMVELSTGYRYNASIGLSITDWGPIMRAPNANGNLSATYVTGSHAFKTGLYLQNGYSESHQIANEPPVEYQVRKATPTSLPTPASVSSTRIATARVHQSQAQYGHLRPGSVDRESTDA